MRTIESPRLRRLLRVLLPALVIPALVLGGALMLDEKRQMFTAFAVAVCAVLLFLAGIERRQIGARRMVLSAVMIALCVAGRLIPFFKPVTALTVLTALYLGGEAGFLVGALSALLSNFYFGQGPWTPFQMLAWGLIGLFAGLLARPLKKSRWLLLCYGLLSGVFFSLVMDVWTVLWYNGSFDAGLWLVAMGTALPHTVLYAASNFAFLWMLARPIGEKLERIHIKYGL